MQNAWMHPITSGDGRLLPLTCVHQACLPNLHIFKYITVLESRQEECLLIPGVNEGVGLVVIIQIQITCS